MSKGKIAVFAAKTTGKWVIGLATIVAIAVAGGVLASGFLLPGVFAVSGVTKGVSDLFDSLPDQLGEEVVAKRSYIYWADGSLMATYFDENREVVSLDEISPNMQNAVVALEDKRFWEHGGIDPQGTIRAIIKNFSGGATEGGSTLAQQYVKNVLLERASAEDDPEGMRKATEQSYARKLREAKMAMAIEEKIGKERVLEGYLNISQFGAHVYGVQAAAKYYFGVDAKDLTVVQAATIAAIAQKPNGLDPTVSATTAAANQVRRDAALKIMFEEGYITKAQFDEAKAQAVESTLDVHEVTAGCANANSKSGAGYFCDYVVYVIKNSPEFGPTVADRIKLLRRGGLNIYTTLTKKNQKMAYEAVINTVPKKDISEVAMALSAVEPGTGKILGMAQNRDFVPGGATDPKKRQTSVNFNTDKSYGGSSGFQSGSTFKMFILAEWLKQGHSLKEKFSAAKHDYDNTDWAAKGCWDGDVYHVNEWEVANSTGDRGVTDAMDVSAWSVNTGFVAMEYKLDLCSIKKTLDKMGIHRADETDWNIGPSMVLGTNEIAPLTMAAGYATFASGGIYCAPIAITKVTDADGNKMTIPQAGCERALKEDVAWGVAAAMKGVMNGGTGAKANPYIEGDIAGKTGTTDSQVAVWFGGFTQKVATAVWAGYSDASKPLRAIEINGIWISKATGGLLPGAAWKQYMKSYMEDKDPSKFPTPSLKTSRGEEVAITSVVGLTLTEAQIKAEKNGLLVTEDVGDFSDSVPKGQIISQRPGAGAKMTLDQFTSISVVVSKGPQPSDANPDNPLQPSKSPSGKSTSKASSKPQDSEQNTKKRR